MFRYSKIDHEGVTYLSVFVPGNRPLSADSNHPNWDHILTAVDSEDPDIADLFDPSKVVARKFDRISDRVTVASGRVYFDGDEVESTLTKQIIRCLNEGVEDFVPLVNFFENVQQNPEPHSRIQLFDWLNARDFTITRDGFIVGYKGVRSNGLDNDGEPIYQSTFSGKAVVNNEEQNGYIQQQVGDTVEMPRAAVMHDPSSSCSSGLHVGTHGYASGYGDTLLEVHVHPRDVVSVPTEANGNKIRVCRYYISDLLDRSAPEVQEAIRKEKGYDPFVPPALAEPEVDEPEGDDEQHPTPDEFEAMKGRAKRRRRNFVKYAGKHGPWVLKDGGDPNDYNDWIVVEG